eukprot:scaffold104545_cov69-Phaeocystis_antarctica.AAC.2
MRGKRACAQREGGKGEGESSAGGVSCTWACGAHPAGGVAARAPRPTRCRSAWHSTGGQAALASSSPLAALHSIHTPARHRHRRRHASPTRFCRRQGGRTEAVAVAPPSATPVAAAPAATAAEAASAAARAATLVAAA